MASTSEAPSHQKNGKGRKKVIMEKMEKKSNLQVTFSKRRSGLFKKGSELCTLTGSNIGIIVFSPGKKVFSFGHPSVHDVVDECFPKESEDGSTSSDVVWTPSSDKGLVEAHRSASMAEESVKMLSVEKQMEVARRWTTAIEEAEKAQAEGQVEIEAMTEEDLVEMGMRLNLLRDNLIRMKNNGVISDQATSLHSVRDETGNPDSDPCVT